MSLIKREESISYTVRTVQREDSRVAISGKVFTKKGETLYLNSGEWATSWSSGDQSMPHETKFKSPDEALRIAKSSYGMPWYYLPDMASLEVIRLTTTFIAEIISLHV